MSRLLSKLTSSSLKNNRSRLDLKFTKLTNSSTSSSPSLSDLHEIAIFSFNSNKVVSINTNLIKCFQIIKTNNVKSLYKNLVKILKTLVIFQYLVQVGSEEFVNSWKCYSTENDGDYSLVRDYESSTDNSQNSIDNYRVAKPNQNNSNNNNNNFYVLRSLLENLESIENSNLCQDNTYTYSSSSSAKDNVRSSLSSIINKLAKLTNYLKDEEDLAQFRLSFQKLRFDMSKPTPRSSMDHHHGSPHPKITSSSTSPALGGTLPRYYLSNGSGDVGLFRHSSAVDRHTRRGAYGEGAISSRHSHDTNGNAESKGNSNNDTVENLIELGELSNDDVDDFDRIDFELIEPNINLSNLNKYHNNKRGTSDGTSSGTSVYGNHGYASSKSLDLNRLGAYAQSSLGTLRHDESQKAMQKLDFRNFSDQILLKNRTQLLDASDGNGNGANAKGLSPLIEVNEPL